MLSDVDISSYEEDIKRLGDELQKPKPSFKNIKGIMRTSFEGKFIFLLCNLIAIFDIFPGRREWILNDSPSVQDIVDKFPPLKKLKYVCTFNHFLSVMMYFSNAVRKRIGNGNKE